MLKFRYRVSSEDSLCNMMLKINGDDYCEVSNTMNLGNVLQFSGIEVKEISISNAHLLSNKQVDYLKEVSERGTCVICDGIKSNFKTVLFEGSKRLFELTDELEEITEFCSYGNKACFGVKITEYDKIINFGSYETHGNVPMCFSCYSNKILFKSKSYDSSSVMKSFLENEVYLNDLVLRLRLKRLHKEDRDCLLHEVICADYYLDRLLKVCDDVSFSKKLAILKQKFEDVLLTATAHDLLVAQKHYIKSK